MSKIVARKEKCWTCWKTPCECKSETVATPGGHAAGDDSLHRVDRMRPAKYTESCDFCRHQEGRHYCLLHSTVLKNMDTIRCDEWQEHPIEKIRRGNETALNQNQK